jgi:hypothetical protein
MLLLRVNEVNDLELAPTLLSQQCGGFVGAAGAPLAVSLRLVKWPLSADCGRATSCKQMNWDDGELVGGVSLLLRPYRERKRTIVDADSQSEAVSR